jgi:hypothetical protein
MRTRDILALCEALSSAAISTLDAVTYGHGPANPCGDGDTKTRSPGTYRPVGATCPTVASVPYGTKPCPYMGHGCYAEGGNVAIHQRASDADSDASIRAAARAMVWAARTGRKARLHVSGDFLRPDGRVDTAYIRGLSVIGRFMRETYPTSGPVYAWTYTHVSPAQLGPYLDAIAGAGIALRWSDRVGASGAFVRPFSDINYFKALKSAGVRYAKCPAQLRDVSCKDCRICWERPSLAVAFDPHGSGKRSVLRVLQ